MIVYPKPCSIYLRGTIPACRLSKTAPRKLTESPAAPLVLLDGVPSKAHIPHLTLLIIPDVLVALYIHTWASKQLSGTLGRKYILYTWTLCYGHDLRVPNPHQPLLGVKLLPSGVKLLKFVSGTVDHEGGESDVKPNGR